MLTMATTGRDGKPLVILGLTKGNIDHLVDGPNPAVVRSERMQLIAGIDASIAIMYGETEEAIAAALRDAGVQLPEGFEDAIRVAQHGGTGFAGKPQHEGGDRR